MEDTTVAKRRHQSPEAFSRSVSPERLADVGGGARFGGEGRGATRGSVVATLDRGYSGMTFASSLVSESDSARARRRRGGRGATAALGGGAPLEGTFRDVEYAFDADELTGSKRVVLEIGPGLWRGHHFGEHALLSRTVRNYSVATCSATELLVMTKVDFARFGLGKSASPMPHYISLRLSQPDFDEELQVNTHPVRARVCNCVVMLLGFDEVL